MQPDDYNFLLAAWNLAGRAQGNTAENPAVGCVIVRDGMVLGAGHTAPGGRPHAETQAIASAGGQVRGATAYVTLEPCAHHGHTPPCAQALIDAGIARVVMGCPDPDARVNSRGVAMLQAAGIEVSQIFLPQIAQQLAGFLRRARHNYPEIIMKIASSADGFMASNNPQQRWLTSTPARIHGHGLRARSQAILTGIGTVLCDDPMLDCRLPGLHSHSPIRIVLDRQLRTPLSSKLVQTAQQIPLWLITTASAIELNASHANDLRERGVIMHVLENISDNLQPVLQYLGQQGVHLLMVEAGPKLSTALLQQQLVDQLYHYHAPLQLAGAGSHPIILPEQMQLLHTLTLAPDLLSHYKTCSCLPD
jgi:diaminohydroxyphosphoribosylaminopyrimidine deaminase/5-amino-6-(5-phosphoribosylamino)uracil reductase